MSAKVQVLRFARFHKFGWPDAHVRIWRRGPEALYVDVEESGRTRTDTWPMIGPSPMGEAQLQTRYEQEFQGKGYGRGEWLGAG